MCYRRIHLKRSARFAFGWVLWHKHGVYKKTTRRTPIMRPNEGIVQAFRDPRSLVFRFGCAQVVHGENGISKEGRRDPKRVCWTRDMVIGTLEICTQPCTSVKLHDHACFDRH